MTNTTPAPVPAHQYHERLRVARPPAWRGIAALVLLLAGLAVGVVAFGLLGLLIDDATGRSQFGSPDMVFTPTVLATSMVPLALLTPWSMLLQKWFFGVPMRSLHSVAGRFRWRSLGRAALVIVPVWAVYLAVLSVLQPQPTADYPVADLVAFVAIAVLLVPLQAAGEEYAFRGLAFRIAASWGRSRRAGLVIGMLVSSVLFMIAHVATDPWLNVYYLVFGLSMAVITWRSGGVELAALLHAVNNTLSVLVALVLGHDLAAASDRTSGATTALMLLPAAMLAIAALVVWWRTRRAGAVTAPAAA